MEYLFNGLTCRDSSKSTALRDPFTKERFHLIPSSRFLYMLYHWWSNVYTRNTSMLFSRFHANVNVKVKVKVTFELKTASCIFVYNTRISELVFLYSLRFSEVACPTP